LVAAHYGILSRPESHVVPSLPALLAALVFALYLPSNPGTELAADRRVVDVVDVGNALSEAAHGYDGSEVIPGVIDGQSYRQTRGWMHFAMKTFDDTPVTIACTFLAGREDAAERSFDLVVEDSVVATRVLAVASVAPLRVEIPVPFSLTKGKTHIALFVRARGGLTPPLHQLRTVQDHYEVQHNDRETVSVWHYLPGVYR
jgi:hypothetical protein